MTIEFLSELNTRSYMSEVDLDQVIVPQTPYGAKEALPAASFEVDHEKAAAVYELVTSVDPERAPAFVGLDQIKGTALATLFLQGYADKLVAENPDAFVLRDPLVVAFEQISHCAGYSITGTTGEERNASFKAAIGPFAEVMEAYEAAQAQAEREFDPMSIKLS